MKTTFRTKQISPVTIKLRTSFDSLAKKSKSCNNKLNFDFSKINISLGKPYKFPQYEEAKETCYSPSSYENPLKKNRFRIQKLQKLQHILLQKNYKFKKACNTSYKDQKTQRFQKTQVAFDDLQQIESINIRRFKQQSDETIKLKEVQKINEILQDNRLSQTIFVRKGQSGRKEPQKLKNKLKKSYFNFEQTQTLLSPIKTHTQTKNVSMIKYLNKTSSYFHLMDEDEKIDAWKVQTQRENCMV